MWITILVMALAVSLEPFRIAMTVLMLNRPKPTLQLLAFLSGGFAMGVTVGLIVIFVLRRRMVATSHLTLPNVQVFLGGLAMATAAVLAVSVGWRRVRSTGREGAAEREPVIQKLPLRVRQLLNGQSLWVATVAGLGIALPSVDYLAALAVILASGAAAMTQVAALLLFNVVAAAAVEISLVACLLAPDATRRTMTALNTWVSSRRRLEVAGLLVAVGCVLLTIGLAGR